MRHDRADENAADAQSADAVNDDPHSAHPIEPAKGARDPGQDSSPDRAEHPTEPAEGERD